MSALPNSILLGALRLAQDFVVVVRLSLLVGVCKGINCKAVSTSALGLVIKHLF